MVSQTGASTQEERGSSCTARQRNTKTGSSAVTLESRAAGGFSLLRPTLYAMLLILVVGVPILGYFLSADWIDPDESTPPPPPPPQLPGELARNAPPAPPSTEGSLGGVWVRALFIVSLLVLVELVLCALVLYVYQLLARSQIAHAAKTLPLEAPARQRGSVVDAVVGAIAPRAAEQSGPDAPASGDSQKPKQASSLPPRVIAPRPINTDPVHVHLDGALAALEVRQPGIESEPATFDCLTRRCLAETLIRSRIAGHLFLATATDARAGPDFPFRCAEAAYPVHRWPYDPAAVAPPRHTTTLTRPHLPASDRGIY